MIINAKITKVFDESKPLKAFADVILDDSIVIHSVAVVETEKGRHISMPYSKWTGKDGEAKQRDICHAITTSAHKQIEEAVFAAYDKSKETI